jgi:hypothetical protein
MRRGNKREDDHVNKQCFNQAWVVSPVEYPVNTMENSSMSLTISYTSKYQCTLSSYQSLVCVSSQFIYLFAQWQRHLMHTSRCVFVNRQGLIRTNIVQHVQCCRTLVENYWQYPASIYAYHALHMEHQVIIMGSITSICLAFTYTLHCQQIVS